MKELRHLNKYFRKYWGKLLVGILITIIARIFSLVMPSYVKNIVEVVEQYNSGALDRVLAGQQTSHPLQQYPGLTPIGSRGGSCFLISYAAADRVI